MEQDAKMLREVLARIFRDETIPEEAKRDGSRLIGLFRDWMPDGIRERNMLSSLVQSGGFDQIMNASQKSREERTRAQMQAQDRLVNRYGMSESAAEEVCGAVRYALTPEDLSKSGAEWVKENQEQNVNRDGTVPELHNSVQQVASAQQPTAVQKSAPTQKPSDSIKSWTEPPTGTNPSSDPELEKESSPGRVFFVFLLIIMLIGGLVYFNSDAGIEMLAKLTATATPSPTPTPKPTPIRGAAAKNALTVEYKGLARYQQNGENDSYLATEGTHANWSSLQKSEYISPRLQVKNHTQATVVYTVKLYIDSTSWTYNDRMMDPGDYGTFSMSKTSCEEYLTNGTHMLKWYINDQFLTSTEVTVSGGKAAVTPTPRKTSTPTPRKTPTPKPQTQLDFSFRSGKWSATVNGRSINMSASADSLKTLLRAEGVSFRESENTQMRCMLFDIRGLVMPGGIPVDYMQIEKEYGEIKFIVFNSKRYTKNSSELSTDFSSAYWAIRNACGKEIFANLWAYPNGFDGSGQQSFHYEANEITPSELCKRARDYRPVSTNGYTSAEYTFSASEKYYDDLHLLLDCYLNSDYATVTCTFSDDRKY